MIERRILTEKDLELEIPEFAFRPNVWTEAFLTALQSVPVENKRVVEIGVGSGIIGIELLRRGVQEYIGLDIDDRVLSVARRNIERKIVGSPQKISFLRSDLLEELPSGQTYDIICGCLPQVSKPATVEFGNGDSYARYFNANKYQSAVNVYGLGLNEAALIQSKTRLSTDGREVLVLSGRAGKNVIKQLFSQNDYKPNFLFEDRIAQLRETTLQPLVEAEEQGYKFFFYKDPACRKSVTVQEAEERRLKGQESYHKIYVIEGKLY